MSIAQVATQVSLMFILMLFGALINKLGFLHEQTTTDVTNILLYFISPFVIIKAFEQSYSPKRMQIFVITFLAIAVMYIVTILLTKLIFHGVKDSNLQRIVKYSSIYSNSGFMGIPIASALFGDMGVFFGVVSMAGFNIFSWSHGVSLFREKSNRQTPLDTVQKVLKNPNIIAIILGLIMFMTSFKLPGLVIQSVGYISSIFTPMSMIIIGSSLTNIHFKHLKISGPLLTALALRNIIYPIITILILQLFQVTGVAFSASIVLASCPVAGVVVLFTLQAHGDSEPAVTLMSLSTILSLITIPLMYAVSTFI